jgi:hypothetical protein
LIAPAGCAGTAIGPLEANLEYAKPTAHLAEIKFE